MTNLMKHTPYQSQWKLVRSAIEHENTLKSHRVTWFLATQLFLFTGFSTIFVEAIKKESLFAHFKIYAVLSTIVLLGLFSCILAWVHISAAQKMIARLHNWWMIHCRGSQDELPQWIYFAKFGSGQKDLPPINGMFTSNRHIIFSEADLPKALAIFWLALISTASALLLRARFGVPLLFSLYVGYVLAIFAYLLYQDKLKPWLASPNLRKVKELEQLAKELDLKHASTGDLQAEIVQILRRDPICEESTTSSNSHLIASPPPAAGRAP
jgi:hypothetical protein